VYFRKGVVASRPDHFRRSLRFKGFLKYIIGVFRWKSEPEFRIAVHHSKTKQNTQYPYRVIIVVQRG